MASIKISELPTGFNTRPFTTAGNQDGTTRQVTLPPAAFNDSATNAEARDGVATTRQMTPANTRAVVVPMERQLANFFQAWATVVESTTTTKGATITGVSQVITTDARTASLGTAQIGLIYDTAIGVPSIAGDTIRLGLLATNDDGERLLLLHFNLTGERAYILNSDGTTWRSLANTDDAPYLHNAHGIESGTGWFLIHHGATYAPSTIPQRLWLVRRVPARLEALTPEYTDQVGEVGDTDYAAAIYRLLATNSEFSSGAADLTGADVRDALETLTGANRTPLTILKRDTAVYGDFPTRGRNDDIEWSHPLKWDTLYETATPTRLSATGVWEDNVTLSTGKNILDYGEFSIVCATNAANTSRSKVDVAIPTVSASDSRRTSSQPSYSALVDFSLRSQSVGLVNAGSGNSRVTLSIRVKEGSTNQLQLRMDLGSLLDSATYRSRYGIIGIWGRRTASIHSMIPAPIAMVGNYRFVRAADWVRNTNKTGTFTGDPSQTLPLPTGVRFDDYTRIYAEMELRRIQTTTHNNNTLSLGNVSTANTDPTTATGYIFNPLGGRLAEVPFQSQFNNTDQTSGHALSYNSMTAINISITTPSNLNNLDPALNIDLTDYKVSKLYGIKDNLIGIDET